METTPGQPSSRPEVRIPLYGLMKVTKRGYFILLALQAMLLAVSTVVVVLMFRKPEVLASSRYTRLLSGLLPAILVVVTVWLVLEAVIVLRRFRREESKQRG